MADADTKPKQAKIVKKEQGEVEPKKIVANGGKKEALSKALKVKKEERTTSETLSDGKVKKKSTIVAVRNNKFISRKKLTEDGKDSQKAKKVYDLPGQKHDPPPERDPLRTFYESTYEQKPTSDMAAFWLMERGLLPEDVAEMVYLKKMKKNAQQKVGTPVKAATMKKSVKSAVKKSPTSKPNKASKTQSKPSKRHKPDTSDSDDDFIVSRVVKKVRAC